MGAGFSGQEAQQRAAALPDEAWQANPEYVALAKQVGPEEAKRREEDRLAEEERKLQEARNAAERRRKEESLKLEESRRAAAARRSGATPAQATVAAPPDPGEQARQEQARQLHLAAERASLARACERALLALLYRRSFCFGFRLGLDRSVFR